MIHFKIGDIFQQKTEAYINPVNCVGVMGAGLALQFKKRFPDNFKEYEKVCKNKELIIGKMFIYKTDIYNPKYIINFPTKNHWKDKSKLEYIDIGLISLKSAIEQYNISSISIPKIGCGLGGLKWIDVKNKIIFHLSEIDCEIFILEN